MKYFELILLLCSRKSATTTTTEPPAIAEIDLRTYMNISVEEQKEQDMENLTPRSFAALFDRSETVNENDDEPGYDAKHDKWEVKLRKIKSNVDWVGTKDPVGTNNEKLMACYYIGTTYKNAIQELRDYYKLRYLYTNNLDYEVGYLVEEIVVHYQIAVELYHLIMVKYGGQRNRYLTPIAYMFYMYINILYQSKTIIHLCEMLHEIEAKYKHPPNTVFEDYHIPLKDKTKAKYPFNENALTNYHAQLAAAKKNKQRELKKQRKKLFKAGITTTGTKSPRKGRFDLHYGWSIEDW